MLHAVEIQVVRAFCERVCSLEGEGAESGETRADRVCVKVGQKLTRSAQPMEAIAVPGSRDPAALAAAVLEQVDTIHEDGGRRVYLTAYRKGATAPCHQQKLDLPATEDEESNDGKLPSSFDWNSPHAFNAAAGHALHSCNMMLSGMVREQNATILHLAEKGSELQTRAIIAETVGDANSAAVQAENFRAAMEMAAPIAAGVMPAVAAAGADWLKARADVARAEAATARGEDGPPETPAERSGYHLGRVETEAAALVGHLQAHPQSVTDAQIAGLDQGLALLGMALGALKAQRTATAA